MPFTPFAAALALARQAATPAAGYTLVNGTGNIITWTAPSDGQPHRFTVISEVDVTSAETGGQVDVSFTAPDGTVLTAQLIGGGQAAGVHIGNANWQAIIQSGSTVTISQFTALTAGAAICWAEIWGA